MRIRFDVTMDDLMAFVRHFAVNSSVIRDSQRRLMIIAGLLITPIIVIGVMKNSFSGVFIGAVSAGILWLISGPLLRRGFERQSRKFYSQPGCNLLGPGELTIEELGIHGVSSSGELTHFWAAITSIDRTETHCFIYLNAVTAFVIPLNDIKEGNVDDFIDEVTRRWQAAKSPWVP